MHFNVNSSLIVHAGIMSIYCESHGMSTLFEQDSQYVDIIPACTNYTSTTDAQLCTRLPILVRLGMWLSFGLALYALHKAIHPWTSMEQYMLTCVSVHTNPNGIEGMRCPDRGDVEVVVLVREGQQSLIGRTGVAERQ